jgi:hypothetical protein
MENMMLFLGALWAGLGVSKFIEAGGWSAHGGDLLVLALTCVAYYFMRKKLFQTMKAFGFIQSMF